MPKAKKSEAPEPDPQRLTIVRTETDTPVSTEIPIGAIAPSPTNPRTSYPAEGLQELAASIAAHGIIEPLLVRLLPDSGGTYQIVAGERRYRAAKLAGLELVPVIVRELTDAQAAELQLVENLQREDLGALDIAAGYSALITKHGYTADRVAEQVRKSTRHVYQYLQLLNLQEVPKQALLAGTITPSIAVLLVSVPPQLMSEALMKVLPTGGEDMPSYRTAVDRLRDFLGRPLAKAPFDVDAEGLVNDGPCFSVPCARCAFNSVNRPALADAFDKPHCTNSDGWKLKERAQTKIDAERLAKKGLILVPPADSKKASQYGYFNPRQAGFVEVSDKPIGSKEETYADRVKEKGFEAQVYVMKDQNGKERKTYKLSEIQKVLPQGELAVGGGSKPSKEEEARRRREEGIREYVEGKMEEAVAAAAEKKLPALKSAKVLTLIVAFFRQLGEGGMTPSFIERRKLDFNARTDYGKIRKWFDALPDDKFFVAYLEGDTHSLDDGVLKALGLDAKALEVKFKTEALAIAKAAEKAAKAAPEKKATATKAPKKTAVKGKRKAART